MQHFFTSARDYQNHVFTLNHDINFVALLPCVHITWNLVDWNADTFEKFCKSSCLRLIFSFIGHKGKLTNYTCFAKKHRCKDWWYILTYSNFIQTSWFDLYDLVKSISIRKRRLTKNECSEFSLQDRQKPNIFYPLWKLNTICQIR